MVVNEARVAATVRPEYVVGRVVELDQLSMWEQLLVARPFVVADKETFATANDEQRELQSGEFVPEGPFPSPPEIS